MRDGARWREFAKKCLDPRPGQLHLDSIVVCCLVSVAHSPGTGAESVGAKSVGAKSVGAKSVGAKSVGAKSVGKLDAIALTPGGQRMTIFLLCGIMYP